MLNRLAFALILTASAPLAAQKPVPSPTPAPKPDATVRVVLTTAMGPITLELEKDRAPITAGNFLRYVDQKRYDGANFYRRSQEPGATAKGFIQGGISDPRKLLPPIAHEPTTKTGLSHSQWAISVPRWAPGTARADFMIMMSDTKWMDANPAAQGDNLGFAVFGKVVDGIDTLRKIHAAPVSPTKGDGPMKGEMLEPVVRIITARRAAPVVTPLPKPAR
jgi:peptidyl-prolyl cis-trans isomerase A (cyclophilin A)